MVTGFSLSPDDRPLERTILRFTFTKITTPTSSGIFLRRFIFIFGKLPPLRHPVYLYYDFILFCWYYATPLVVREIYAALGLFVPRGSRVTVKVPSRALRGWLRSLFPPIGVAAAFPVSPGNFLPPSWDQRLYVFSS